MTDAIYDVKRENQNNDNDYDIKKLANILRQNRSAYLEYIKVKNILQKLGVDIKKAGDTVEIWKKI